MTSANDEVALSARDAEARRLAESCFDRPLVLEAGAGTGKTTLLVARIVVWCAGPGWERSRARLVKRGEPEPTADAIAAEVLQRVVAITFTEAAAAEMARRAGAAFVELAQGKQPKTVSQPSRLPDGEDERRLRGRALVGALDRLVVRTIHAFCRRLLAAHPFEAGLRPDFEVDADGVQRSDVARLVLERRLRTAWSGAGDDVHVPLARLGVTPDGLETELLALLAADVDPSALAQPPFSAARLASFRDACVARLSRLRAVVGTAFDRGRANAKAPKLMVSVDDGIARLRAIEGEGADAAVALAAVLEEALGHGESKLSEWARGEIGKLELEVLSPEAAEALPAVAANLVSLARHATQLDPERLELARRALGELLADARAELARASILSFAELLRRARDLLGENVGVRETERARIDQLLVDEFQDTDATQCALVASLAFGGAPETRPGLFVVGDPKQSIYAWRSADLAAFDAFVRRTCEEAGGERHPLVRNFRSVRPVLEEVERTVRPVMVASAGVQPAFQHLVPDRGPAARGAPPAVEFWDSNGADGSATSREASEREAAHLARDLAALFREGGVARREVGVLFRSTTDLDVYLQALREAGIPYAVERDRSFYRRREIVDAAALVACIVDPNDVVSFVAFLRSPAVGVPDAALLPLFARDLHGIAARLPHDEKALDAARQVAREAAALPARDVPGLSALRGWETSLVAGLEALAVLRESFEQDAPERFVEKLRVGLLGEAFEAARPLGAFRVANLERFLRELAGALADGADAGRTLRAIRASVRSERAAPEGRPPDAALDAVRVMSIHGAKGLGFQHTYVMQLHKQPRAGGRDEGPFVDATMDPPELRLLGAPSLGFESSVRRRAEMAAAEEVRTLYVAMTRAKDRLVMAGRFGDPAKQGGLLRFTTQREPAVPALEELRVRLAETGESRYVDEHGVCWRLLALADATAEAGAGAAGATEEAPAPDAAAAERLETLRSAALRHQRRPLGGPMSARAHEALRELFVDRTEEDVPAAGAAGPGGTMQRIEPIRDRALAAAVGTAIHRALEIADWREGPAAIHAQLRASVQGGLAVRLSGEMLARASEYAEGVLTRFAEGPLLPRLRALAPHVLARELPVLRRATDDGPVSFLAGAVDLVYEDPGTKRVVVVDYKTALVAADDDLRAVTRAHAVQAALYADAVRDGLGLDQLPATEIWYLAAGRVEVC